ncbi:MAG: type II toxin-antitoxin system VapC family toxin [Dethiobacter sp.]|nr:type II toxin-antitoxin system VapC family toxin [Dethiobacter sp.]
MSKVVLDAYAVLALIENETGSEIVESYLADEKAEIFLSVISLGEIYYILMRRKSQQAADELVSIIQMDESVRIIEATWPVVRKAATVKARGGLSYADSFVVSLALEHDAVLVTGDPEILAVSKQIHFKLSWLGT